MLLQQVLLLLRLVLQPVQLHLFLAAVQHHRVLVLPPVQLHLFLAAVQHHRVLVLPVVVQRRVLLRAIPSLLEILLFQLPNPAGHL
ncbi:hypothetical protein ATX65_09650 [Oenococcus oeni]|nr:hypothetical protein ATX65_09650 [Oenococcus oeni]